MQYVLVFGNQGSFFTQALCNLRQHFFVYECLVDRLDPYDSLDSFLSSLEIDPTQVFAVVYLGGETRDVRFMHLYNYYYPRYLFEACSNLFPSLKLFFYLSSLSVFSYPCENPLTSQSARLPNDTYGITKNLLDDYFRPLSVDISIFAIAPGSIVNPLSCHGVLAKIKSLQSRLFLKHFLRLFVPRGEFHCVLRSDLYSCIIEVLTDSFSHKLSPGFTFEIFSSSVSYANILNSLGSPPIFLIPYCVFYIFNLPVFSYAIRKKAFLLFTSLSIDSFSPHLLSFNASILDDP